jgi:hypothetical protein
MQPTRRETQDEQLPSPSEEAAIYNHMPIHLGDTNH